MSAAPLIGFFVPAIIDTGNTINVCASGESAEMAQVRVIEMLAARGKRVVDFGITYSIQGSTKPRGPDRRAKPCA